MQALGKDEVVPSLIELAEKIATHANLDHQFHLGVAA
jgi:hypothetical protein